MARLRTLVPKSIAGMAYETSIWTFSGAVDLAKLRGLLTAGAH